MTQLQLTATRKSSQLHQFAFDDQTYKIRRNLMVSSAIGAASVFLSPIASSGLYEVNIGVMKGSLPSVIPIYIFLSTVCLYYLVWFYIHCKKLAVDNFQDIQVQFSKALTSEHAEILFLNFIKKYPKSALLGLIKPIGVAFKPVSTNITKTSVVGEISNQNLKKYPESLIEDLKEDGTFAVSESTRGLELRFSYELTLDDRIHLDSHLDKYWRTRAEELFVTCLPIICGLVAISLLAIKIYRLTNAEPVSP
ncbi:hypothetical protein HRJ45_15700 [Vibrio coralliilyticus]|uniref:hypothetical protein n=1 Tax=Vibrio coralliilyticus TaxID=190893 RepID=UPI0015606AE7|nr:hypothetical protein [Vibrio coralliilyticus]NRF26386.1 hypothetical protein [Vibrio coralliilyticus]NRF80555.1 hypothetical protein [Vibrio coralliilyticus]